MTYHVQKIMANVPEFEILGISEVRLTYYPLFIDKRKFGVPG